VLPGFIIIGVMLTGLNTFGIDIYCKRVLPPLTLNPDVADPDLTVVVVDAENSPFTLYTD